MNILMIAPSAPPKNGPEAMQVSRYLSELDKNNRITLVTTPVQSKGWVTKDESLNIALFNTNYIFLKLPFHSFFRRLLGSRYLKFFLERQSDIEFWISYKVLFVLNKLTSQPDIIYSRSMPFSAAILAKKLKQKMDIPWVMHLSDPWIDSPYRQKTKFDEQFNNEETACFEVADAIMLTTESMAKFYQLKYPEYAQKIYVSYNVMPNVLSEIRDEYKRSNQKLTLMYAGALYGERKATTILEGLSWIKSRSPQLLEKLEVMIVGNMTDEIRNEIEAYNFKQVKCLGKISYAEVIRLQEKADILLSIEPDGKNPLLKTFMPSKILDYMASGKPILAITPEDSETWKLCKRGFGWAIKPNDGECLGKLLNELAEEHFKRESTLVPSLKPLREYSSQACVEKLEELMKKLVLSKRNEG